MTFKELKNKIKEEQKSLAHHIKELKGRRKQEPDGYVEGLWHRRDEYRHNHIAYCEFFNNTPYNMIEKFPREDPVRHRIDRFKSQWAEQIDEALRHCA